MTTAAIAGSCARIASWSRLSSGPGSSPSSSASTRRASWKVSSASACRPPRYSASISCPHSRSRNGLSASADRSSGISSRCSPSASATSNCSSSASTRSVSSRRASLLNHAVPVRPCSAGPRHRARAASTASAAEWRSPSRSAARVSASNSSNRSTSTRAFCERVAVRGARDRRLSERGAQARDVMVERVPRRGREAPRPTDRRRGRRHPPCGPGGAPASPAGPGASTRPRPPASRPRGPRRGRAAVFPAVPAWAVASTNECLTPGGAGEGCVAAVPPRLALGWQRRARGLVSTPTTRRSR